MQKQIFFIPNIFMCRWLFCIRLKNIDNSKIYLKTIQLFLSLLKYICFVRLLEQNYIKVYRTDLLNFVL